MRMMRMMRVILLSCTADDCNHMDPSNGVLPHDTDDEVDNLIMMMATTTMMIILTVTTTIAIRMINIFDDK